MKSPLPNRRDIVAAAATAVGIHAIAPTATADMPRPALTFRDHLLACLGGPWPEPCPLDVRPREPVEVDGLACNPMHHTGVALAKEGYVVLCPDAVSASRSGRART
jgi:hypothetical protein